MDADAPAVGAFGNAATEGVAHHLVAETDADEGFLAGVDFPGEIGKAVDPRLIIIDAELGPGGYIGVELMKIVRGFAVVKIEDGPLRLQPVGEHGVEATAGVTVEKSDPHTARR